MVANRLTGHVAALNMMNIMQNRAVSIRIRPETPYVSHAYHLILGKWGWGIKANKPLRMLVEVNLKTGKFGKIPDSYRMESVFWNLGGYLVSEKSNWKNVKQIYESGLYKKYYKSFGYSTGSDKLW